MSDINDLIPALKRAVAPPGQFDALYPEAGDTDLVGRLLDGLAEAQLDGFLATFEVDATEGTVTPDISSGEYANPAGALILLYAAYTLVISELRNLTNKTVYTAGPVSAEEERTASMLNEILRQLADRKRKLIERAERGEVATDIFVGDLNFIKGTADWQLSPHLEAFQSRGV